MHGCMDGWMNECMVGWMDVWMAETETEAETDVMKEGQDEEKEEDKEEDEEEETHVCRPRYILDHVGPDVRCQLHDLSIMRAIKSQYKAVEHIETLF